MKNKKSKKKLRHDARHLSIKEGILAAIKNALGNSYIAPFAVAINASSSLIALLTSITGLLGPISQWQSSRLIEKYSRKKIIFISVLLEGLMWLPIISIAFLFYKGILTSLLPLLLLIFFAILIIFAHMGSPAWFSWMGDVVDANYRGKWFAKRNFALGAATLIFTILAAFFLDFFKKNGWIMFGFIILFALAMIIRLVCLYYFLKTYEPKIKVRKKDYFSLFQFIKKAPSNNFGRFALFRAALELAAHIATPFFTVYMLRNLGFSYSILMAVILSQTLFSLFIMKWWGRFADRYGNYQVLKITSILIPIYPVLWLISGSPIFLIFGPGLIKGVALSGFNLSAGNFIYDSVKPQKRGLAVSYYSLLNGVGIFIGAGIGAILVKVLTISFMDILLFMFLLSGFARLIVILTMIPFIKEVKRTEKFDSHKALQSLVPKRVRLSTFEGAHELIIRKRFR